MEPKRVKESAVDHHVYKVFPNDLNAYGTAFGGMIMSTCDRVANIVAERHSQRTCVTISVDSMHFLKPAGQGDVLLFSASINHAWHTSMEIGVKVEADHWQTGERRHILSAYFTFVALDENRRPTAVPPVLTETPLEKRRFEEAIARRERRIKESADRKRTRSQNPIE